MGGILKYKDELAKAMQMLAEQPEVIFLGQTVQFGGSFMSDTLKGTPINKRIELPVAEDMQMGMSIGLSLMGFIPVSIYPRMDFLLLAMNQLVNHLDKIEEMSCGQYKPKVIIRTCIGAKNPLYPGLQHCGDYTTAFKHLLKTVAVVRLTKPSEIMPNYEYALYFQNNYLMIEEGDLYGMEQSV